MGAWQFLFLIIVFFYPVQERALRYLEMRYNATLKNQILTCYNFQVNVSFQGKNLSFPSQFSLELVLIWGILCHSKTVCDIPGYLIPIYTSSAIPSLMPLLYSSVARWIFHSYRPHLRMYLRNFGAPGNSTLSATIIDPLPSRPEPSSICNTHRGSIMELRELTR